jgi:hypothetical protein
MHRVVTHSAKSSTPCDIVADDAAPSPTLSSTLCDAVRRHCWRGIVAGAASLLTRHRCSRGIVARAAALLARRP